MDAERAEILDLCYRDHGVFCKTFLPEKFSTTFCSLHTPILDKINRKVPKLLVLAPRGIGKTSIAQSVALKAVLYREVNFVVYVSSSATIAEMQTENMRYDLMQSKEIKAFFGDIKVSDKDIGIDEAFSKKSWVAYGNTLILPRGSGQQIRGLNWRGHRPGLVIIDDLEDVDEIHNELNRRKTLQWMLSDVTYSISRLNKSNMIFYIDTLKHEDAVPRHIEKHKEWTTLKLALCDDKMRSLAPEFYSDQEIQVMLEDHRATGTLDVFYRELLNEPTAPETASFRSSFFRYFSYADLPEEVRNRLEIVIVADPAKSVTPQSDYSAIIAAGLDIKTGIIYILEVLNERLYPDAFYEELFAMGLRHKARVIGYEVTGLNEFITFPLYNEMSIRNLTNTFEIVELKPRGKNKLERIKALSPFYRRGLIYHAAGSCDILERQLLSYPNAQYDDVTDCAAYAISLFDAGDRFALPSASSEIPVVDEYEGIFDEPALDREEWATL